MTALMAMMVYLSGYFFDLLQLQLYWIMAAMCVLSVVLVLLSYLTSLE